MGEGEESKLGGEIDLLPIIDLMMQFMALLESKSYSEALKLSETILKIEPENKLMKRFAPVLLELLSKEEDGTEEEEEESSEEESEEVEEDEEDEEEEEEEEEESKVSEKKSFSSPSKHHYTKEESKSSIKSLSNDVAKLKVSSPSVKSKISPLAERGNNNGCYINEKRHK